MADFLSSERPRTPPRSSEIVEGISNLSTGHSSDQSSAEPTYFGHIKDLIYPIGNAEAATKWQIPPAYRKAEAVDSSLPLGRGASFSASLQRIPGLAKETEVVANLNGRIVSQTIPPVSRPKFVVYKTAQLRFAEDGTPLPEYRRALRSVLTEIHALVHPSLMNNQNIIDFVGFAWGSNPLSPSQKLPAIIVEYAEHGTLANLLADDKVYAAEAQFLSLDIARGLSALHQTGLTHGDVKADNILICSHPDRNYIAKIADFGFSIIEESKNAQRYVGGTRPWMAPEVLKGPVAIHNLPQTDIYSFGLLCWVIFLDGRSPVDYFTNDQGTSKTAYFEEMKCNGSLQKAAIDAMPWLTSFCHARYDQDLKQSVDNIIAGSKPLPQMSDSDFEQLKRNPDNFQSLLFCDTLMQLMKAGFFMRLMKVFGHSLALEPRARNLQAIIAELELDMPSLESMLRKKNAWTSSVSATANDRGSDDTSILSGPSRPVEPVRIAPNDTSKTGKNLVSTEATTERQHAVSPTSWEEQGFMRKLFSWQKIGKQAPSVQNLLFTFLADDDATNLFLLSALHMNGYGCSKNSEKSLDCLRRSAEMGSMSARSNLFRISATFLPSDTDPSTIPGREYLYDYARMGSRMAMVELERVANEDERERCKRWVTDAAGGVGAITWLNPDQMLNGFTQNQWIKDDWSLEKISQVESPTTFTVNKRGDTILHFMAMCGRHKPFSALLTTYKADVNIRNSLGETPILAACRSGHGGIVFLCLRIHNADASLAAVNGETPLHWLCQLDNTDIQNVVADLVAHGANVEAATKENVSHSLFPGTLEMDFMLPGTPLHWAVHRNRSHVVSALLKHGANPDYIAPGAIQSPICWAAYWHHPECLKAIIEHQETKVTQMTTEGKPDLRFAVLFGPLLESAINGADKYSMILRHGVDWLVHLHSTLDLLREKTRLIRFSVRFQGSMLYYAVQGARDEVVDYMFQHEWRVETINQPVGEARRTPFLEAVRWNRRPMCELLRKRGASATALAANPFEPQKDNWSALHILAHEGHDKDVSLAEWLIENGVPVDGQDKTHEMSKAADIASPTCDGLKSQIYDCETAFAVAVRGSAFKLANEFLRLGANPNALSLSSGIFTSDHPLTIIGHVIASNARCSVPRLKYLFSLAERVDFIVEPKRHLTALHRAAMAHADLSRADSGGERLKREEFDFETNAEILRELLHKWNDPDELNAQDTSEGNTALHLAVQVGNVGAVEALLEAGASRHVLNNENLSPEMWARDLAADSSGFESIVNAFSR